MLSHRLSSRVRRHFPLNGAATRDQVRINPAEIAMWGLLILFVSVLAGVWYVRTGNIDWDDAYISFRYSRNLVDGYGLVWNPGGEHTQGYTNFLFVILVAGGMKLGLLPFLAAHMWNTVGLLLIVIILGWLSRALLPGHRWAWIIPPLAFLFLPSVHFNMLTGMETVFWTGLVLAGILCAQRAVDTGRRWYPYGSLLLFFLGTLTRPETVLIAALILLYLLLRSSPRMRLHVVLAAGIMGAAGLAYLYWANWYFGDFLPNSFYVKVNQPGALPGLDYVLSLFSYFAVMPLTYPGLLGLLVVPRQQWRVLLPYTSLFVLAIFYLFVSPLMGDGYRFLFPLVCLFYGMISIGLLNLILWLHRRLFQETPLSHRIIQRAGAMMVLATALAFLLFHFGIGGFMMWQKAKQHDELPLLYTYHSTIGRLLGDIEGSENMVVAFGDAGKIAYYSNAQFLDVVGLNENTIARKGNREGADWVIGYVLDQQPDLLGFYTFPDGQVYHHIHGILGSAYYDLYMQPDFQDHYQYAGGFDSSWGLYAQFFVRTESPYADALLDAIHRQADVTELGVLYR